MNLITWLGIPWKLQAYTRTIFANEHFPEKIAFRMNITQIFQVKTKAAPINFFL